MATGINLSDKYAATAAAGERHWDAKLAGFFLECGKTTKTWYVESKGKRTNLGRYPAITASDAREAAKKVMGSTEKATGFVPTLQEALDDYLTHGGRRVALRSDHNKRMVKRQMELHMTKFLKRRLDTIGKTELRAQHDALKVPSEGKDTKGRPCLIGGERTANHVMQSFRTIWNHARDNMMDHDLKSCPTAALRMADPEKEDIEIIDDLEKWKAEVALLDPLHRAVYRLLLTTGMRKTECLSLTWAQVLEDRIHLPASVTKNGRPFDVPLEPEHRAILNGCRLATGEPLNDLWVFPSSRGEGHLKQPQPISWSAQLHRATFATKAREAGLAPWQVGQLLNHTIPGVTSKNYIAKNVDHYRPFMRTLLDALPV